MENKKEILDQIAKYETLLEQAHIVGTELRTRMLALPQGDQQNGLSWRIAESVSHVTTAQTYGKMFRNYAGNNLKEEGGL